MKIHSSCEIEDFVETHLCKLCVILRSRVLRVVCPHEGYRSATPLTTAVYQGIYRLIVFFFHTFTFRLLDKPWDIFVFFFFPTHIYFPASGQAVVTGVVPSFPPVLAFNFSSRIGFSDPMLVDSPPSVANSRSRAFRKSTCAQEKVPTNLYEYKYALGGIRTHETDLYQARG